METKFKAFDEYKQKVYDVIDIKFDYIDDKLVPVFVKMNRNGAPLGRNAMHVKLMQYADLTDKNGIEIYQGYIVKSFEHFIHEVVKQNGAFGYISDKYTGFISFAQNYNFEWINGKSEKLEYIGNVHENPELLQKDAYV